MEYKSFSPRATPEAQPPKIEQPVPQEVRDAIAIIALRPKAEGDDWREKALCSAGADPEIFDESKRQVDRAKKFCESCEVEKQCLDYALTTGQGWMVYGKLTHKQRSKLKNRRR